MNNVYMLRDCCHPVLGELIVKHQVIYRLHLANILHSPTVTSPSCGRATKSPMGSRGSSGFVSVDETEINIEYFASNYIAN